MDSIVLIGILILLLGSTGLQAYQTLKKSEKKAPPIISDIPFNAFFESASTTYHVSKRLLVAIASVESNFNSKAVNNETEADKRKGRNVDSLGVMQILYPDTAQALRPSITREQLFDAETNINLGAKLLSALLNTWKKIDVDGFPTEAIAAYNAGHPRYNSQGSLTNQRYVDAVKNQWREYANA